MHVTSPSRSRAEALVGAAIVGDVPGAFREIGPLGLSEPEQMLAQACLESTAVEQRLTGAQVVASAVRGRGNVRLAADIALELIKTTEAGGPLDPGAGPVRLLIVANILDLAATSMPDAGRSDDLLRVAPSWLKLLDQAKESSSGLELEAQARSIRRAQLEASMRTGHYELASQVLADIASRYVDVLESPIERRLADKLDDLLRAVDKPDTAGVDLAWVLKRSGEVLAGEALPEVEPSAIMGPEFHDQLRGLMGLSAAPRGIDQAEATLKILEEAPNPFEAVASVVSALGDVLQDKGAVGGSEYERLAGVAAAGRSGAAAFGFWEEAMTLGWIQSIALRRAGRLDEAATVLEDLRAAIRKRQMAIGNPRLRAALAVHLPHLPTTSAEVLYELGPRRAGDLFTAIEDSKARILGDLLSIRFGEHGAIGLDALADTLRLGPVSASYLTLLLGDVDTYGVFVGPDAVPRAARLPLGRDALVAATIELGYLNEGEPGSFRRVAPIDQDQPWDRDYGPALQILAPLANWLDTLFTDGHLTEDSVLCISPDGPLYNMPLTLLEVGGVPLIDRVALTIVPSVGILQRCVDFRQHAPRSQAVSAIVPRSTEFDSGLYDAETYGRDAAELAAHWSTEAIAATECDGARIVATDVKGRLLHIAAHGYFDSMDPLGGSGLALAFAGALPPGRGPGIRTGLFTPRHAEKLDAQGAHVTLRACVTGRTTEVTSREALGMVWSLFTAGASSVMAASWKADVRSLAACLTVFYRDLATSGSVALAHRTAVRETRSARQAWGHPYHHAAVGLFGFWQ